MSVQVKERPILFSAPMVRAILAGRKTQTRRIIKPQDRIGFPQRIKCPYGAPGDLLWVRERCRAEELPDGTDGVPDGTDGVRYAADDHFEVIENTQEAADRWVHLNHYGKGKGRSIPSIHMPKWASRITLEITDVRVERLDDINEADAMAEGATPDLYTDHPRGVYFTAFAELWKSINGPDSWFANPWVWVVEFERIEP